MKEVQGMIVMVAVVGVAIFLGQLLANVIGKKLTPEGV